MHKVTKKDWGAPTKQKKKHRVVFRIFLKYRNFAAELKIITMEFTGKIIAILQERMEIPGVRYRKPRPVSAQNVFRRIWR